MKPSFKISLPSSPFSSSFFPSSYILLVLWLSFFIIKWLRAFVVLVSAPEIFILNCFVNVIFVAWSVFTRVLPLTSWAHALCSLSATELGWIQNEACESSHLCLLCLNNKEIVVLCQSSMHNSVGCCYYSVGYSWVSFLNSFFLKE